MIEYIADICDKIRWLAIIYMIGVSIIPTLVILISYFVDGDDVKEKLEEAKDTVKIVVILFLISLGIFIFVPNKDTVQKMQGINKKTWYYTVERDRPKSYATTTSTTDDDDD